MSLTDAQNIVAYFSTPQRFPTAVRRVTLLTRTVITQCTEWVAVKPSSEEEEAEVDGD